MVNSRKEIEIFCKYKVSPINFKIQALQSLASHFKGDLYEKFAVNSEFKRERNGLLETISHFKLTLWEFSLLSIRQNTKYEIHNILTKPELGVTRCPFFDPLYSVFESLKGLK